MPINTDSFEAQVRLGSWPAANDAITMIQDEVNRQEEFVDVTLTAAQVKALFGTPITLVPAPGAGKALVFEGALLFLDYGTAAFDGIAAGEDLTIKIENAAGATLATVETTGFMDAVADAIRYVHPVTTAAITPIANKPLVLHMLTADIGPAGDSVLKVRVHYRTVPTTL